MATLEAYRNKFAESGWQIFERAIAEARSRNQNYVGAEHMLHALTKQNAELFTSLLRSLAASPDAFAMLVALIEQRLDAGTKHEGDRFRLARETIDIFKRTMARVRSNGRRRIEATDLFITLLMDENSLLRELLAKLLADPRAESNSVRDLIAVVEYADAARRPSAWQNYEFLAGEVVRIKSGPFAAFMGTVTEIDKESSTLNVMVFIFGREMPVELKFLDVEKIKPIRPMK